MATALYIYSWIQTPRAPHIDLLLLRTSRWTRDFQTKGKICPWIVFPFLSLRSQVAFSWVNLLFLWIFISFWTLRKYIACPQALWAGDKVVDENICPFLSFLMWVVDGIDLIAYFFIIKHKGHRIVRRNRGFLFAYEASKSFSWVISYYYGVPGDKMLSDRIW